MWVVFNNNLHPRPRLPRQHLPHRLRGLCLRLLRRLRLRLRVLRRRRLLRLARARSCAFWFWELGAWSLVPRYPYVMQLRKGLDLTYEQQQPQHPPPLQPLPPPPHPHRRHPR